MHLVNNGGSLDEIEAEDASVGPDQQSSGRVGISVAAVALLGWVTEKRALLCLREHSCASSNLIPDSLELSSSFVRHAKANTGRAE